MGKLLKDNPVISNFFSGRLSEKGLDFMAMVLDQSPNYFHFP